MKNLARKISFLCLICAANMLMAEECPKGYYDAVYGKKDSTLKSAISKVIRPHTVIEYGSGAKKTWCVFYYSDQDENGYCMDMYSDDWQKFTTCGTAVSGCNIEHSFAKSWWGSAQNDAYKDCYHLNPSNSAANSARSSYALGEPTSDIKTSGSLKVGKATYAGQTFTVFEPKDEYKGDFARAYFYMATCYGDEFTWNKNSSGVGSFYAMRSEKDADAYLEFQDWEIEVLLKWHRQDSVSEKEIKRMDAVSNFQHNRNPYIDHPEWVEYIWGNKKGQILGDTIPGDDDDDDDDDGDDDDDDDDDDDGDDDDGFYSIADLKAAYTGGTVVNNTEVTVKGYITAITVKPSNFSNYHSAIIWMSDTKGKSQDFELYNCYSLNQANFSSFSPDATGSTQVSVTTLTDVNGNVFTVGDQIAAFGKFKLYNSIYELQQGCYIVKKYLPLMIDISVKLPSDWDVPAVYSWSGTESQVEAMTYEKSAGDFIWWKGKVPSDADGFLIKNEEDKETWTLQTFDILIPSSAACYEVDGFTEYDSSTATYKYIISSVDCVVDVKGISLNRSKATITKQKSVTLVPTITPTNASNKNVTWSTSNSKVATVANGVVTGVSAGTATITATTANGGYKATCQITVTNEDPEAYTIAQAKAAYTNKDVIDGDKVRIKGYITYISVKPSNFSNYHSAIIWLSDTKGESKDFELFNCYALDSVNFSSFSPDTTGSTFVGVSSLTDVNGNEITLGDYIEATGSIELYTSATESIYELRQGCYISKLISASVVAVTGISLDPPSASIINGTSLSLSATLAPENASNQNISWSTSNGQVATVLNGVVFATGVGTATITATSEDGGYQATCQITVTRSEATIQLLSANTQQGVVFGSGEYKINTDVLIGASGYAGYRFERWSDGNKAAARKVYLSKDTTITAYFTLETQDTSYVQMIEVNSMNPTMGTAWLQAYAEPQAGYVFQYWSDYDTSNPRVIEVLDIPQTFTAVFAPATYTAAPAPEAEEHDQVTKRLKNGQLVIKRYGREYTVLGQ